MTSPLHPLGGTPGTNLFVGAFVCSHCGAEVRVCHEYATLGSGIKEAMDVECGACHAFFTVQELPDA